MGQDGVGHIQITKRTHFMHVARRAPGNRERADLGAMAYTCAELARWPKSAEALSQSTSVSDKGDHAMS
jgi:hypothetical protein